MYNRKILVIITSEAFIKLLLDIKNTKDIEIAKEVNKIIKKAKKIVDNNTKDILLYWEGYKYNYIKGAMFLTSFFNDLNYEEYKLIILGDDLDDIEENGHLYNAKFNPHIIRKINFNKE